MTGLFRAQAVEAKRVGRMGTVVMATPLSLHLATLIALLMGAALLAFILLGHYTRRERVHGTILAAGELVVVAAPVDGIAGPLLSSGTEVQKGDILTSVSGMPLPVVRTGTVYDLRVSAGDPVMSGQTLLTVLDKAEPMRAVLEVSERAAGFVANGTRVVLRYPVFPHQRFGYHRGRVSSISRVPIVDARSGARYRVYVDIDDAVIIGPAKRREVIRPGMVVDADIFLEKRTLAGWALAPLFERRSERAVDE